MAKRRSLYWFTNDLRLDDNPLLNQVIQSSDALCFLYIFDPFWLEPRNYHQRFIGGHYLRFVIDSLMDIEKQITCSGHRLHISFGDTREVLKQLFRNHSIDLIARNSQIGWYEQLIWQQLQRSFPDKTYLSRWNNHLFNKEELFYSDQQQLPLHHKRSNLKSFTQFRHFLEGDNLAPNKAESGYKTLPYPMSLKGSFIEAGKLFSLFDKELLHPRQPNCDCVFAGGEHAAKAHVENYFASKAPSTYKHTRNSLEGWQNSTKFSPYLAHGNLSPCQLWEAVEEYEKYYVKNEDTYWIKFELLWREYFHWLAERQGINLFRFSGLAETPPLTSFLPERFKKWCNGNTPYPIVNACIRQLNTTGYMSNRGRQLAASCLVNELAVDWRYGAAYFQEKLIDHDLASNWGNWQYIAGVGTDPRNGRQFNLTKQTELYDPTQNFIQKWQGQCNVFALDSVDASDWPITQKGKKH